MLERLEVLRTAGLVADLDVHFARLMVRLSGGEPPELALAACLASRWTGSGHVCVDLAALAGRVVLPEEGEAVPEGMEPVTAPPMAAWRTALRASTVVGVPGEARPLVLDGDDRLYLHRYWEYERGLADLLVARAGLLATGVDEARLRADLARFFPPLGGDVDWQKVAAATAALRRLCVISGGPGTGKTSTVIRILAVLLGQTPGLRIRLAAPTGKAAARLAEAIGAARARERLDPEVAAEIPGDAHTIHRLLGARRDGGAFRHGPDNPLPVDVLVVDEASMVDLALMARLVAALPPAARLIALGDRDQLASVEAGAVLGDLCGPAPGFSTAFSARVAAAADAALPPAVDEGGGSPLRDAVVLLRRSWRFAAESPLGRLAAAVNAGEADAVLALLTSGVPELAWRALGTPADLRACVEDAVLTGFTPYFDRVAEGAPAEAVFAAFGGFRVLCAHRAGPTGAETVNRRVEALLRERGVARGPGAWYPGRPVLVMQNDYELRLFNGDVGIALSDPDTGGALRVVFEGAGGVLRRVSPVRLPPHETAWAMTVHKSQGSEFDRVLLMLPAEPSRVMTREIVYTGITRARRGVTVCGEAAALRAAVERRMARSSGLRDALWGTVGARPGSGPRD